MIEEIYALLEKIKLCNTMQEANEYFLVLAEVQSILAYLAFVNNINLPQELRKILRDCDRLDDINVRNFLFKEIKQGTYNLQSDTFLWYK